MVCPMHTASVSQASGTHTCGSHLLVRQMLYASNIYDTFSFNWVNILYLYFFFLDWIDI
jgi:hypothetical protein